MIQFSTSFAAVNTHFCSTNRMCVGKPMYSTDPRNGSVVAILVRQLVERFKPTAPNTRFGWLVRVRRRSSHGLATSYANI